MHVAVRQGAYDATRAAALSGVPRRTIYRWHKTGIVSPTIHRSKLMLWSYEDLLLLRLVSWLRQDKAGAARSSMHEVRRALEAFGDDLWSEDDDAPTLVVAPDGSIVHQPSAVTATGQGVFDEMLDLFASFASGIDLRRPRSMLRIVPGRCAGEIHLAGTRLTSPTIHALVERGYTDSQIALLYPLVPPASIAQARDVERALTLVA